MKSYLLHAWHIPLVVIALVVFFCLGLEELGQKKNKSSFSRNYFIFEREGPRFVCISWLQPFTKLFLPLTLLSCFLILSLLFLIPHICSSFSYQYLWQFPLGSILPFLSISLTLLYCCLSLPCWSSITLSIDCSQLHLSALCLNR